MKADADQLAKQLESELGVDAVSCKSHELLCAAVDGKQPTTICSPKGAAELCAVLRLCGESDAAVTARGGGTAMRIGNSPMRIDVIIDVSRMNRLIEHDDANLTATVDAGIRIDELQQLVAERNQFLPFEPPSALRASIGGTIAANLNGPRRSYYGNIRDLVIGMRVALADGEHIKAGGKVVKNVAGYDMCKLLVGSFGTLGIITEVTVRMAPLPEMSATILASASLDQTLEVVRDLSRSLLLPSAVSLTDSGLGSDASAPHNWQIAIRCEGFTETVGRQTGEITALARRLGLAAEVLDGAAQQSCWRQISDFPLSKDRLVYRITVPRSSVASLMRFMEPVQSFSPTILCDPSVAVIWIATTPSMEAGRCFAELRSLAEEQRGHAVMFCAPAELKGNIDVWGTAPPAISLMREVKRQLDPRAMLNPGRFVAGI